MPNIQGNTAYYFTNLKGGTCIDLSGGDNTSVTGFDYHKGSNQSWTFENAGADQTWYIKSSGGGQYLSVQGDLHDGQKTIGSGSPFKWRLEDVQGVDNGVRVLAADDANYSLDLADHGNSAMGTPIQVWGKWGGENQVWKLQQV